MNRLLLAVAVTLAPLSIARAAPERAAPEPGFAITVYSSADPATFDPKALARQQVQNPYAYGNVLPGYGVVREVRKVTVADDRTVRFADVASGIDPTTVTFESLTDPARTSVLEQAYEYDVVSGAKLLDKYLGKSVTLSLRSMGAESVPPVTGTLLSSDGASIVVKAKEGVQVISRGDVSAVALADAANLITKPTLVWHLSDTARTGEQQARVTYQTDGLTWRADYSVSLNPDDSAANIGAWVTLLNQSGASYPNASLKLVAGDVRARPAAAVLGHIRRPRMPISEEGTSRRRPWLSGKILLRISPLHARSPHQHWGQQHQAARALLRSAKTFR